MFEVMKSIGIVDVSGSERFEPRENWIEIGDGDTKGRERATSGTELEGRPSKWGDRTESEVERDDHVVQRAGSSQDGWSKK